MHEHGLSIPKIHDLDELLDLVLPHAATLGKYRRSLNKLTEYAVEYRYPGMTATVRQARSGVRQAGLIREETRRVLGLRPRNSSAT